MTERNTDPRKQFSKKLAGRTEWFWFLYMILLLGLVAYRPEVAMSAFFFACLVTIVMVVSVLAYTNNSKYEKGLWAANELAKMKFKWTYNGTKFESSEDNDTTEEDSEEDTDEESNEDTEEEDSEDTDDIIEDSDDESEEIVG